MSEPEILFPLSFDSASPRTPWKAEMASLVRDPQTLCALLGLQGADAEEIRRACGDFPLRVPRPYLNRITRGDPQDPLLLQVLPQLQELTETPGYSADPLDEAQFTPVPGLLHKYQGRVLVVLNGNCAIHCRYCFRRHFPYKEHQIGKAHWQRIVDYIAADTSIREVIFSGGDPLTVTDSALAEKVRQLDAIAHLKRLRLHTRVPVMIPSRINDDCLAWLRATRLQVVCVIHANHANEIDAEVLQALDQLRGAGVTLLNQTVLLRGVNDAAETLIRLSETLSEAGVMPYYLHQLDAVQGAAHFAVSDAQAAQLMQALRASLPGYLVPRLVREDAHSPNKTPL
ncbi:EF-P beta-lysylation protein EpmB [Granulosicoccaceae sp. 1_MG-2023]|nr:EF-P beta-lysylation protein EpmB [Granulosicoccaceae sp. 1_MG-2023]